MPYKKSPQHSSILYAGLGCIAGVVAATLFFFTTDTTVEASPSGVPKADTTALATVRNVVVNYMYETDPHSASGHNALEADSIEFYPNYVLVKDASGQTLLLTVDRLRRFSFTAADLTER